MQESHFSLSVIHLNVNLAVTLCPFFVLFTALIYLDYFHIILKRSRVATAVFGKPFLRGLPACVVRYWSVPYV